jgi:dihydrofolate reductase
MSYLKTFKVYCLNLILASDSKGGIGYKNNLPWSNLQGDLPRFKRLTLNQNVVMGYNTFGSLPNKPLKNRINYVLTNKTECHAYTDTHYINNIDHAPSDSWIIGGAKVISDNWHKVSTVHLTLAHKIYMCDTFIDLNQIFLYFVKEYEEVLTDHTYMIWKRK